MPDAGHHEVVPSQFIGAARLTVQRFVEQDRRINQVLTGAFAPIKRHSQKHPSHRLEHLVSAERALQGLPSRGLLAGDTTFDRTRRTLNVWQLRIVAGSFTMRDWRLPHIEPALMLTEVVFQALKGHARIGADVRVIVAMRALAQWLRRSFDTSERQMIEDLALLGREYDVLKAGTRESEGHRWSCATESSGRWVGYAAAHQGRVLLATSDFFDAAPEVDDITTVITARPAPLPPIRYASFEQSGPAG